MKAWLSQNQISYVDRDILATPPSVQSVIQMAQHLDGGIINFVHPQKSIDGEPARSKLGNLSPEKIAERLVQEPDLFYKPVLANGQTVVVGPDFEALNQLLPTLK